MFAEKRFFSTIFFLAFLFLSPQGWTQSSSPYSRFGIGDIPYNGFIKNLGMGETGLAERPDFNLNIANPASYSSLLITTFDVGLSASFVKMSTTNLSQKKSDVTFSYFALGFPVVNKKWGMGIGLVPFSSVGYKMVTQQTDANAGDVNYSYEGTGGINRFFIGNAFSIKKNFSVGVDASYLFGTLNRVSTTEFQGSSFFNSRFTSSTLIKDFYFHGGLQYVFDSLKTDRSDSIVMYDNLIKHLNDSIKVLTNDAAAISRPQNQLDSLQKNILELKNQIVQADSLREKVATKRQKSDWSLSLGLLGSPPQNISASQDSLTELYQSVGNFVTIRDTILDKAGDKGNIHLPVALGFGISLKKGNRWIINADASMQNWQDYSFLGQGDSLQNSFRTSTGFQFTPDEGKSYWKSVQYRFGAFYHQTYLELRNTQLNEYGITVGLGLPISRAIRLFGEGLSNKTVYNRIQLSAMIGRRGTTDNSLIKEDFVRVSIGITFSDKWFIKPKYE